MSSPSSPVTRRTRSCCRWPASWGVSEAALAVAAPSDLSPAERLRRTAGILDCRGYAVSPRRLGELCLGGALDEGAVSRALAASPDLDVVAGLIVSPESAARAEAIAARAQSHREAAPAYLAETLRFTERLVALAPFVVSVAIAGSLASGGFAPADDVDLNLVVEDGYRHQAYVLLNLLGYAHALRHRGKPVDDLTRRPVAPRLMTANLILERSDWRPLRRVDSDMAFELLVQVPIFGGAFLRSAIAANPRLFESFPQLADRPGGPEVRVSRRLPAALYPAWLEGGARRLGEAGWRWMMWTRRHRPDALRRVQLVRETMRPYALFNGR